MARISTHVLDIEKGRPAPGIVVELCYEGNCVCSGRTNNDGRTDQPLFTGENLHVGFYECVFHTGDYLGQRGEPGFYDRITIRFRVADGNGNYHIPLLLASHGYSTYRGS